jgi:hypothetical protein
MGSLQVFNSKNIHLVEIFLVSALGREFIKNEIESFTTVGLKKLEAEKVRKKAHPLCQYWSSFKESINKSQETGELTLNEQSAFLVNLYYKLKACENVNGIKYIIARLKDKKKFHSTWFELNVAEYYILNGMKIEVIEEGVRGQKTPDFLCITPSGEKVLIEAKHIEDKKNQEDNQWEMLLKKIDKIISVSKRCVHVDIKAIKELKGMDTSALISNVTNYCSQYAHRNQLTSESFDMIIQDICKWDDVFVDGINAPFMMNGDIVKTKFDLRGASHSYEFRHIRMYNVTKFTVKDNRKALERNLTKANKQIKEYNQKYGNLPSVVHIGIPHTKSKHVMEVSELAQEYFTNKINVNFSNINAIVIQGYSFNTNTVKLDTNKPQNPIASHQFVLPSFESDIELPIDFKFNSIGVLKPSSLEGRFVFSFNYNYQLLKRALQNDAYGELFSASSYDGKCQIRALIVSDGYLQVQFISKQTGIIKVNFSTENKKFKLGRKIEVQWDAPELKVLVDDVYLMTPSSEQGNRRSFL